MTNLAMEKQHLAKADRDIAEGELRVAQQTELVNHMRRHSKYNVAEAERLLQTLQQTLQTWREHRVLILDTISRIENGEVNARPLEKPGIDR